MQEEAVQCHHLKSIFTSPEEGPMSCGTYVTHDARWAVLISRPARIALHVFRLVLLHSTHKVVAAH